jgi:hypothetical protein
VAFASPLRSVASRNGPKPAKKWGAGWDISGTKRFNATAGLLVEADDVVFVTGLEDVDGLPRAGLEDGRFGALHVPRAEQAVHRWA